LIENHEQLMPFRIRHATPADAEDLAKVRVKSWQTAYKDLLPDEVLDTLDLEENSARFLERLENPEDYTSEDWVCERDGCVIGWLSWMPGRDADVDSETVAELLALYALPEVFGQGVGHALMEAFLTKLRSLDSYKKITLWVLEENQRAIGFYGRHGFEADGQTKDLVMAGEVLAQEIRYVKDL
jgi:ribosomal protein S18 acetylase RimI-like enzyme